MIDVTPENATLSAEDISSLKKLVNRYIQIKAIIAYAEEIQPDHKSDILVYKELRDSMDHLMRVLYSRLINGNNNALSDEYRNANIEKAIGHLYRAAFDALDITILSFKEHITSNLKNYSTETVKSVIQDYYNLKIKLNELTERAASRREKKDIGPIADELFDEYVKDVSELRKMHEKILYAGPELDAFEKSLSRKWLKDIIQAISLIIFGVVIKWLVDQY